MKRRPLSKITVAMLGGIDGAAGMLGTTPGMIRRWMRLGLSADGRERVRSAMSVLIKHADRKRKANSVAKRGSVLSHAADPR